jgi:hypothetical protein
MFKVEAEISLVWMEDAVRKSLREKGMSEEAIEEVLVDMMSGTKDVIAYGIDTEGSESGSQDKVSIQGTEGTYNTFYGSDAGFSNTTGSRNTFIGRDAGYSNTTGWYNTYIGMRAGYTSIKGYYNTFMGYDAGRNTTGSYNTFIGKDAGYSNTTGSYNTSFGYKAGLLNATGDDNVFLGHFAGYNETGSHKLYIENTSATFPLIYGEFDNDIVAINGQFAIGTKSPAYKMEMETTGENAAFVLDRTDGATNYINATASFGNFGTVSNHPLRLAVNSVWRMRLDSDNSLTMANGATCTAAGKWQDASSRELKENIQSLTVEKAKEALDELDPVRFNYKADKEDECLGFIAEDVPELVASKDRKSMSAMDVVAILTKIAQEQQRLAEEQQNTIADLQKQIDELKSRQK